MVMAPASFSPIPPDDDVRRAQWRAGVLRLSRCLTQAATVRPDLAAILMEAFDCALEQLLLFGNEADLRALENWLSEGANAPPLAGALIEG